MAVDYNKPNYVLAPFLADVPAVILLLEQDSKAVRYLACSHRWGKCVLFQSSSEVEIEADLIHLDGLFGMDHNLLQW